MLQFTDGTMLRWNRRSLGGLALFLGLASLQGCFEDSPDQSQDTVLAPVETPKNPDKPDPKHQTVDSVPKATGSVTSLEIKRDTALTWRSQFIRDSSEIPFNAFKVFYFEDSTETIKADSERVAFPVVNYAYTGPHGIPAHRFNAFWIGKFVFDENTTWRIDLSQSWSTARIIIDNQTIYSGQESQSLLHHFTQGIHLIEIEYKNDWHTIAFSVLFSPERIDNPVIPIDTTAKGAEYWFAGVYQSDKNDLSVDLVLEKSQKPVVLFLSSYEVVRWNIHATDSNQVLAVFMDSYKPQSTLTGLRSSIPVTVRKGIPYAYQFYPDCYAQTGHCSENNFVKLVDFMAKEFQVSLTGFSGSSQADSLILPETLLDSAKYQEIAAKTKALEESVRLRGLADVFPGDTSATWQAHFVTEDAQIPVGKFQAIYFSDKAPQTIVHSEIATVPAMKYSWSDFHSLDANHFAGYWIGKFEFAVPTQLVFGISQSHAQTAIFVNKKPILTEPTALTGSVSLPAGTHLVEIQHINNWHTIDFAVSMDPK